MVLRAYYSLNLVAATNTRVARRGVALYHRHGQQSQFAASYTYQEGSKLYNVLWAWLFTFGTHLTVGLLLIPPCAGR